MKKKKFRYGNHNGIYEEDTLLTRIGLACVLLLLSPFMLILYFIEKITKYREDWINAILLRILSSDLSNRGSHLIDNFWIGE